MDILAIRTFDVNIFEQKLSGLIREYPDARFTVVAEEASLKRFPKDGRFRLLAADPARNAQGAFSLWSRLLRTGFDLVFYGYDHPGGSRVPGGSALLVDAFVSLLLWKRVRIYTLGVGDRRYSSSIIFFLRTIWRAMLAGFAWAAFHILRMSGIRRSADNDELGDRLLFNGGKILAIFLIMAAVVSACIFLKLPLALLMAAVFILTASLAIILSDIPHVDKEVPDMDLFDSQLTPDELAAGMAVGSGAGPLKRTIDDETRNCFPVTADRPLELTFPAGEDRASVTFGAALKGDEASGGVNTGSMEVSIGSTDGGQTGVVSQNMDKLLGGWNDYEIDLGPFNKKGARTLALKVRCTGQGPGVYLSYPSVTRKSKGRNILVIVIDALRPDKMGIYNNGIGCTPSIDEFFRDKTVFRNAYAQEVWTRPAFASMMTGLYPSHHQLVGKNFFQRLPRRYPLLAEVLRSNGYRTFAYLSHRLANQLYGYARGFDSFVWRQTGAKRSHMHLDAIRFGCETLLNNRRSDNFVFLHLFDTHIPFFPRSPYYYRDNLSGFGDIQKLYFQHRFENVPEESKVYYNRTYENKIKELDLFLGMLLDKISSPELRDNTHVILTADHGTTLFEKGCFLKDGSYNLIDARVNVPLLLSSPGASGGVVDKFVESSIDLYSTVLDIAGLGAKAPSYSRSFFPGRSGKVAGKEFAVSEIIYRDGYQVVVRDSRNRYQRICGRDSSTGEISLQGAREMLSEPAGEAAAERFRRIIKDLKLAEHCRDSEYYQGSRSHE